MNIPKKIHLTCKDKNNIDNRIWKECLEKLGKKNSKSRL